MLRSRIIWCVGEAERIKGSPGTTPEVATVFQHHYGSMINTSWLNAFIQNLYREDTFYADKGMLVWSLQGPDGSEQRKTYETFSQKIRRQYPGYVLDKTCHLRPGPDVPVINLKTLMNLLRSEDQQLWENAKWMFDGKLRFLDGERNKS